MAGLALIVLGVVVVAVRMNDPAPRPAGGDMAWQLVYSVDFVATAGESIVRIHTPWDTTHLRLFAQNVAHPGMRLRRTRRPVTSPEVAMLATRNGALSVQAAFDIHHAAAPFLEVPRPTGKITAERREALLAPEPAMQSGAPEIAALAVKLAADKADSVAVVDAMFDHVRNRLPLRPSGGRADALGALLDGPANALARVRLMVALCRASGLPARVVTGFVLAEEGSAQPVHWMQVLEGSTWQSFDPERGHARTLPQSYLPVRFAGDTPVEIVKGEGVRAGFHLEVTPLAPGVLEGASTGWHEVLDLARLPLVARSTLAVLMLLPVAVVCTLACRRLLGVRSFGTFTPALLGLAATALDWRTTLVVFCPVILLAGAGRAVAPRLRLVRELRLGVVFLMVAMGMAYGVSLLGYLGHDTGDMVLLLPLVVLTMLVDRFYTVADESGVALALRRLAWTVILSVLAFVILLNVAWGHWFVLNPLAHAVTVGVVLLLGTYRGTRLSETVVGRWLGEPRPPEAGNPS